MSMSQFPCCSAPGGSAGLTRNTLPLQALDALIGVVQPITVQSVGNAAATDVPLRPLPEVKGIFGWGYTLQDRLSPGMPYMKYLENATNIPPFFFANGEYDQAVDSTEGTYDRVPGPFKAAGVLANLRHFSIADRQWLVRNETVSTLPQAEQVARVTALASIWFAYIDAGNSEKAGGMTPQLLVAIAQVAPVLPLIQAYWAGISGVGGE